jgi:hypothetical protein
MKKQNIYRTPWIDHAIEDAPDGLLHVAKEQGDAPRKRSGPEAYTNTDEIRICLDCPLKRCVLDDEKHCRRLSQLIRLKRKERQKHDENSGNGPAR